MTDGLPDFISPTLRRYMTENDLRFTDFETAGLIYNSPLPPEEKYKHLEALADETDDVLLRSQIAARLQFDREDMDAFKSNAEGYVYVVNSYEYGDREPFACGFFADFEPAYEHGRKQGCKFDIEKYRIVGLNGIQPLKSKAYRKPDLTVPADVTEFVEECDDCDIHLPDGCFRYDKDGRLTYYHCASELRDDREVMHLFYDPDRFENSFIFMPDPFELGDIVKCTDDGEIGIVATSREERDDFHERIRSGRLTGCDFSDACITVYFLCSDGTFSHDHVNPAFLEKYEPEKGGDDYEILTEGSRLCRGKGSLEWFTDAFDSYRKKREQRKNRRS